MTYVLRTLEREIKTIEKEVLRNDLMRQDMKQATLEFKKIAEIKKAIKILKAINK